MGNDITYYDIVMYYEQLLTEYTIKLFQDGIKSHDCSEINRLCTSISQINKQYQGVELDDIQNQLNAIYIEYYKKNSDSNSIGGIPLGVFFQERCSSIIHLLYANHVFEKIKLYSSTSFMFLCQFHVEKTPSFGAAAHKNLCHCFGCGFGGNVIDYIMEYERLTRHEALSLLSRIYLIDISHNVFSEDDPLVLKYQQSLLSEEFKNLILSGYERTKRLYGEKWCSTYENILNTIERVKNGESIKYIGKTPKILKYNDYFD